ncbi:MAG TPA: GYD domain-containing protein [Roseiarcus sp.]|nr:GYD domain-containing protein [Roseiarcus sp.]
MPKYLFEGRYNAEGAKGVAREGGSGRREAIKKMLEGLGGKLDSVYFAFGDIDAYVVADLPDNEAAAAASLAVNQSGVAAA